MLSPAACTALTALVLASAARAFLGPPARRSRRTLARTLLAVTTVLYLAGAGAAAAGTTWTAVALVLTGIEVSCLGAWLVRGHEEPPGEDDDDSSPWDWDTFDRARAAWARRPVGV